MTKTDPRGYTTTYTYDLYDRVTQETNPQSAYTTYTYNKDNTIDTTSTYTSTGLILTKNKTLYDNYGHITKSTNYLTPATSTNPVAKQNAYNKDFDVLTSYDENNTATYYTHDFIYYNRIITGKNGYYNQSDVYGKRKQKINVMINPASGTGVTSESYTYDGDTRLTRSTNDILNKYKSYTYNNLGYIIQTTDEMNRVTDIERDYR